VSPIQMPPASAENRIANIVPVMAPIYSTGAALMR
jgi:hypothetical protein